MSDLPPSASAPQSVPAGWYPSDGGHRWWDGVRWTEHFRPLEPAPEFAAPQAVQPGEETHRRVRRQSDAQRLFDPCADLADGKNTPATMALVFGIIALGGFLLSFLIGLLVGMAALAIGIVAVVRSKTVSTGKTKGILGIVFGSLGILGGLLFL